MERVLHFFRDFFETVEHIGQVGRGRVTNTLPPPTCMRACPVHMTGPVHRMLLGHRSSDQALSVDFGNHLIFKVGLDLSVFTTPIYLQ